MVLWLACRKPLLILPRSPVGIAKSHRRTVCYAESRPNWRSHLQTRCQKTHREKVHRSLSVDRALPARCWGWGVLLCHILPLAALALIAPPVAADALTAGARSFEVRGSGIDVGAGFCEDGVVKEDGGPETGWGFVPSVEMGIYVQRFEPSDLVDRDLEKVCLCWLRTRPDADIDFDLVLFGHDAEENRPENEPIASLPVVAEGVPEGLGGKFYCYDVARAGFRAPVEPYYLGARWNASDNEFFFLCADTNPATPIVDTFFSFENGEDWESVLVSDDPIFKVHRATMVRFVTATGPSDIPTLGTLGLICAAGLLLVGGLWILRRK